ncbi:CDP-alcohol phosphatidyltransferase family protein [Undibacterium sp. CY18W]|uniref:CDP-alcohol phosphatidyltransferase family protein n=1 Tax=Undibacterium hunanense TaxID=2762292 RepID=A0ABR6ZSS3_9BURK|nr:CDP-alcohol phosphatidyltransferase family protein [Undibacterium hunanense]MBC3918958.1 CDP-alcohol phosphatidyltransferase family protein [Undibacterium hunanense]
MSFSIYQLKPRFQQLLQPVLNGLAKRQITPNQITLLAMLLSIAYGIALACFPQNAGLWLGLPVFMFVRMALNAIDGMLANFTQQKTPFGAILNEVADQVSDAALVLPFALVSGIHLPLLVAVAMLALLVEFAGVAALLAGSSRRFDGPMGKSDRAFAFGVLALLVAFQITAVWLNAVLGIVLLLLLWTLFNRIKRALLHPAVPPTR